MPHSQILQLDEDAADSLPTLPRLAAMPPLPAPAAAADTAPQPDPYTQAILVLDRRLRKIEQRQKWQTVVLLAAGGLSEAIPPEVKAQLVRLLSTLLG